MKEIDGLKIIFDEASVKDYLSYGCRKCNKEFVALESFLNHFINEHMMKVIKVKP